MNGAPTKNIYRDEARRLYHKPRGMDAHLPTIEVDPTADVSDAPDGLGAWVSAWAWIPKPPEPPEKPVFVELNKRELAMVLASLRTQQYVDVSVSGALDDVKTDGGTFKRLTDQEIEALCQRINLGSK